MALLKIVTHPNYFLRNACAAVRRKYIKMGEFQKLIDDMIETMRQEKGIGLAAPQVGKSLRVIIATDGDKPLIFINPRIYRKSFKKIEVEEGCLSVPGVYGIVRRHAAVSICGLNRDGQRIRMRAKGMVAVIVQHEVDHLNGKLFIDKAIRFTTPPTM